MLTGSHDIGRRHIGKRTHIAGNLAYPAAADPFLFLLRQMMGITHNPAFAAAQRNVHNSAFPGHPHGKRLDGVVCFLRVETNSAFIGTPRIVMLHSGSAEHLNRTIVHAHRYAEIVLSHRVAQQFAGCSIQTQLFGYGVKLFLGKFKGIKRLVTHRTVPYEAGEPGV